MMRARLADEAAIASRYGTGTVAFIRGAMYEFSQKGMYNRIILTFCAFALQNMSGAAGMIHARLCSWLCVVVLELLLTDRCFKPSTTTPRPCSARLASLTSRSTLASTAW